MVQEEGLDAEAALKAVQAATTLTQPNHTFLAGGDVRMGDFILLVDSDTRVPQHCILPVVSEHLRSPHVAFTQHYTTPLQACTAPPCDSALLHAVSPAMPASQKASPAIVCAVTTPQWRKCCRLCSSCCHCSCTMPRLRFCMSSLVVQAKFPG